MRKNVRSCIEQPVFGESKCLLDMNNYGMIESNGLSPDLKHQKSAHMTAAWRFADTHSVRFALSESDLTAYRFFTFSVFSVNGAGGSFVLRFESDREEKGMGGYLCTLPITHNGWNDYRVEASFLRARRNPKGWDQIDAIVLDAWDGGQSNSTETVLYIDSFFGWDGLAPYLYTKMPELKGAAIFSKNGCYSIVDRRRIPNALDGDPDARPFEEKGVLWLPLMPLAAVLGHLPVADNKEETLNFLYRRKKYVFSSQADSYTENGEKILLGFKPAVRAGMLFFPVEFVRNFFRYRQVFTDPMGLVILSNRKDIFDPVLEEPVLWRLQKELALPQPNGREILEDLHKRFTNPDRGRLLLTREEWMNLRRRIKVEETLSAQMKIWKERFGKQSEAYKAQPLALSLPETPAERLEVYRLAKERIVGFAALFCLTGERHYADRVAAEEEAFAALSDWDKTDFVNVATIGYGMAIGYDWCHGAWSEGQKARVERAMLRNAMRPAVDAYTGKGEMWRVGTAAASEINAGIAALALAMADVYPETANKLLDRVLFHAAESFEAYAPDGGFAEGAQAWSRGTRALVLLLAMFQCACGKTYGLDRLPGFAATARFPMMIETANGAWNVGTGAAVGMDTAVLPWFSLHYGSQIPAWWRRRELNAGTKRADLFDMIFGSQVILPEKMRVELPLDAVYRKAGMVALRSGFGANDTLIGLHGGKNNTFGGELDAGSVILESQGERFFAETGGAEELPVILRKRAEGQNTLTIDPPAGEAPDQNPDADAKILEVRTSADRAFAVVDMSSTKDTILRGKRGILLTQNRKVSVVQDEIVVSQPCLAVWSVWTMATVEYLANRTLILEQNGKKIICKLSGVGSPAKFAAEPQAGGFTRITVEAEIKDKMRLAVACKPYFEGDDRNERFYEICPMSRWGE